MSVRYSGASSARATTGSPASNADTTFVTPAPGKSWTGITQEETGGAGKSNGTFSVNHQNDLNLRDDYSPTPRRPVEYRVLSEDDDELLLPPPTYDKAIADLV